MKREIITIICILVASLVFVYIVGGFYYGHKTIYNDYNLRVAKNQFESIDWKKICSLEEKEIGGITSYSFDCGGKFDEESEKFKEAVNDFVARTPGLVTLKLYTRLSNQVWNEARMEPISIWAFDSLWMFQ